VKQKKRHPGGMMPPRPLRKLKPLTPMMGPMGPMGPIPHHMPPGGTLSPCGDLGELGGEEALKVFSALKKMGSKVVKSSKEIPLKRNLPSEEV
jgi:hypothetical protein